MTILTLPPFLLPFLFSLAVVYGALEIGGVFESKGVKAVISFVLAFFAISTAEVVSFINQVLPYAVVFFVIVFFLGFVAKAFKKKEGEQRSWDLIAVAGALLILILVRFGADIRQVESYVPFSYENMVWILGIAGLIIILYAVYKYSSQ